MQTIFAVTSIHFARSQALFLTVGTGGAATEVLVALMATMRADGRIMMVRNLATVSDVRHKVIG